MSTGMHYVDIGLGVALFLALFWWTYTLTSRSHAQRKLNRAVRQAARQPWGDDKDGGRGNR